MTMTRYTYISDNERVKVTTSFFCISAKYQVKRPYRGWVTKFRRYYGLGLRVNPTAEIIRAYKNSQSSARVVSVPTVPGIPSPVS